MHVVFVAPFAAETTQRFVRAAAELPGVRLATISQVPARDLPESLRARLVAHRQVTDALDADQLTAAVRGLAGELGDRIDRLLGILEQAQVPLATVRERLGIRGMDVGEATNFREKARMKDVLRAAGVPCARHARAVGREQALAFAERVGFPLVVKPPAGAGAKNTLRVEGSEQLASYLDVVPPSTDEPLLLEEFVTGREHSLDTVTVDGRHVFCSISRYHPTPLEVLQNPWLQWCVLLPRSIEGPEFADAVETGRRALDALGMVTGMTHMEWFRRPDGGVAISEVAARPPGAQFTSLISWAHDRDFYKAWAELVIFERFDPPERRFAVGAVYLRGQGRGPVVGVRGVEEASRELGELVVEARLPQPGQAPAGGYEGQGHVILRHPETEVVERGLDRILSLVRVEQA